MPVFDEERTGHGLVLQRAGGRVVAGDEEGRRRGRRVFSGVGGGRRGGGELCEVVQRHPAVSVPIECEDFGPFLETLDRLVVILLCPVQKAADVPADVRS